MIEKFSPQFSSLNLVGTVNLTTLIIALYIFTIVYSSISVAQTDEDSASVNEFIEAYQQTFHTRDAAALSEFFTEDADFLMFNLPEIRGRQAIENFWRNYWRSKFNKQEQERSGRFNLNSVRFLADDVALINIETTTGGQDSLGVELQIRKARGMWLLNRQNGSWLITVLCGMPTERDSIILGASIETAESLRPHIRAFVDAYENAFDSHNTSAVTAFFREDADIIVRNGSLIHGTKAIQEFWRSYFSVSREYKVILIIEEIRTISDEIVQVNLTITGAIPGTEGKPQPLRQTSVVWILVRDSGGWRIDALRVLPGKDDIIIRR